MAMKKKFLALAMAAAVALPAGSVYANTTQTVEGTETKGATATVPVVGSVDKADGSAAAGKIMVELPTQMTFGVDKEGNVSSTSYNVENKSSCGIDVSVETFSQTDGTIELKTEDELADRESLDRSNVALTLSGNVGGVTKKIDLGKIAKNDPSVIDKKVLNVSAGSTGSMALNGIAGTGEADGSSEGSPAGVDKDGATGNFTLVFKITKDTK